MIERDRADLQIEEMMEGFCCYVPSGRPVSLLLPGGSNRALAL